MTRPTHLLQISVGEQGVWRGCEVDAFSQFDGGTAQVVQTFQRHLAAAFLRAARRLGHQNLHLDVLDGAGPPNSRAAPLDRGMMPLPSTMRDGIDGAASSKPVSQSIPDGAAPPSYGCAPCATDRRQLSVESLWLAPDLPARRIGRIAVRQLGKYDHGLVPLPRLVQTGPLVGRANVPLGRGRFSSQRAQMIGRFPFSVHVAEDGAILLDRLFERGQVPTEAGIDCLRAEPPKCLATERGILELSLLHGVMRPDEGVDGALSIMPGCVEEIDPEGLVGLLGHVRGSARP